MKLANCHTPDLSQIIQGNKKIVLAGNPNTGKSVFFNYFTGLYADVSNYPGTTLEIAHGKMGDDAIADTPGVYGISSFNDEEKVARDIILNADIVINVVNALHLERDLFLTQQVIDTGIPVIVALNMMDEVKNSGMNIDTGLLSEMLGVPVIPTVAIKNKGLAELKARLHEARPGNITPELKELFPGILDQVPRQGEALLILEGDEITAARNEIKPVKYRKEIYQNRRERVNSIADRVIENPPEKKSFSQSASNLMINPFTGIPILLLVLYGVYQAIGVFIAQTVVGITEESVRKA